MVSLINTDKVYTKVPNESRALVVTNNGKGMERTCKVKCTCVCASLTNNYMEGSGSVTIK